ncbi:MAG: hypothetical protein HY263_07315 [Chloroflexi bacterium]|nr:hypothetical protein [Chloroflexota bacterium]
MADAEGPAEIGSNRRFRAPAARILRSLGAVMVGGLVGWAMLATGMAKDTAATLVVIGFSPDRAVLLGSLTLEVAVVTIATLVTGSTRAALATGVVAFALHDRRTFLRETWAAVGSSGPLGTFDPTGWTLTVLTLAVTAIGIGWGAAVLSSVGRRAIIRAIADLGTFVRRERQPRLLARPIGAALVVAILIGTTPVLGDMLNYEPDAHMRAGGALSPGLVGGDPAIPGPETGGGVTPTGTPVPPGVLSPARPWLAWRPTGSGSMVSLSMPAPWGPSGTRVTDAVYLPPGYGASQTRYPVLYEVPWVAASWSRSVNIAFQFDSLIDSGVIPASIVVFLSELGGPYPDSECVNSADGREWFDSWVAGTAVPMVDATFRTIARPAARAVMGFSQGGFCAAMLTARHPDLFATSIAFSGYFQAGIRSGSTPNAWLPFGGSPSLEAQFSPLALIPRLATATRRGLLVELSANPAQPFYGPQYAGFAAALRRAGVPVVQFPTPLGHAWAAIRDQLGVVLETWAERMVALGTLTA